MELAVTGALSELTGRDRACLFERGRATDPAVADAVATLVSEVRADGDAALRAQVRRFDGVTLDALEVPRAAWDKALATLTPQLRAALEQAAAAIATFHRAQLPPPLEMEPRPGLRLGRRAEPLRRVGVYAPGGRAAYPSSVLMGVVPARVAGVDEVVVCSPSGADGRPPAVVLAACALAGADRVFAVGGVGAVAAMALGTDSVPRVDRIVGPGNAYVTEAKRQLTGQVAIDCPAGPSEVLVVADGTADPELVALELLAQAEHDPDAAAVAVVADGDVARAVRATLPSLSATQPRRAIIETSLARRGGVLSAASLDEALAFAERFAPEHLVLMVREPRAALGRVRAAGTIFLGAASTVAFGDYITGANHVLPTATLARAYAGLSVLDFLRWTTYQELSAEAAATLVAPTVTLATAEGLPAHAAAAARRGMGGEAKASGSSVPAATAGGGGGSMRGATPRRAAYAALSTYDPGRRPTEVDLSDNTNLWGPPPAATAALGQSGSPPLTRYPSVYADALRRALAERAGVAPACVTTGCGSDDVLDSAIRAFCEPGDVVAYADPTFSMVPSFVRMNAARPVPVPLTPAGALDVAALLGARARIVYVCRPNNPTGTLFDAADVTALARGLAGRGGVLLLDEAYIDFSQEAGLLDLATGESNVLALRTLSKAWALAGLRVGWAVGDASLVREVEKSRGPYKVGGVAEAVALAALEHDGPWVAARVAEVAANRDRLRAELERRGVSAQASHGNFLLVPCGPATPALPRPAAELAAALRGRGVQVRPFAGLPGGGDGLRVTIGPWPLMQRFLDALDAVRAAGDDAADGYGAAPAGLDADAAPACPDADSATRAGARRELRA